ncbi:pantoate--beta-alanine ligase [Adhaeribacter pallidiroseus]|uniref:Pantothenate synthetase n=1 Tax=Adhaeribacter pallidiroseus TaxID=2072847 RepID=A0A369QLR0_9BACT|nr:pantoate--beta-alanine ligase [Adhaeribacter pallidiroseus]RDC65873.1 Pantoate--beta-alanine ligase (AMP-forming) [Adhaeribacter pallidiroseus]
MQVVTHLSEIKNLTETLRAAGKTIGFVPTMGALHAGHLELLRTAVQHNTTTICSIFVNPIQFNNSEDYRLYPKTIEQDITLLQQNNCNILFMPDASEMYTQPALLKFNFGALEQIMEGFYRPGHFNGVATVVSKLFHLIKPHRAYFGQKDLQQFAIIRQLVRDLSFDLELVCHEIVREADGLAMSSRNQRLSTAARRIAPRLYEALQLAVVLVKDKQVPLQEIILQVNTFLQQYPGIKLEYFEIVDAETLQPISDFTRPTALCLAAYIGNVRLIDNIVVEVP